MVLSKTKVHPRRHVGLPWSWHFGYSVCLLSELCQQMLGALGHSSGAPWLQHWELNTITCHFFMALHNTSKDDLSVDEFSFHWSTADPQCRVNLDWKQKSPMGEKGSEFAAAQDTSHSGKNLLLFSHLFFFILTQSQSAILAKGCVTARLSVVNYCHQVSVTRNGLIPRPSLTFPSAQHRFPFDLTHSWHNLGHFTNFPTEIHEKLTCCEILLSNRKWKCKMLNGSPLVIKKFRDDFREWCETEWGLERRKAGPSLTVWVGWQGTFLPFTSSYTYLDLFYTDLPFQTWNKT